MALGTTQGAHPTHHMAHGDLSGCGRARLEQKAEQHLNTTILSV